MHTILSIVNNELIITKINLLLKKYDYTKVFYLSKQTVKKGKVTIVNQVK